MMVLNSSYKSSIKILRKAPHYTHVHTDTSHFITLFNNTQIFITKKPHKLSKRRLIFNYLKIFYWISSVIFYLKDSSFSVKKFSYKMSAHSTVNWAFSNTMQWNKICSIYHCRKYKRCMRLRCCCDPL